MNQLERHMVEILRDLKDNHNSVEIKAEFEAEGTRLNELMRLKDIVDQAGVGLILKIGGGEAIRDMYDAQIAGVSGIMAPMIESGYAMKKYLAAVESSFPDEVKQNMYFSINIETKTAYENLDAILTAPGIEKLKAICIGRVDLSGSLGLDRKDINSPQMLEICKQILQRTRLAGLKNKIGGGIAVEAIPFLQELEAEGLIDHYETRKIVFAAKTMDSAKMEQGILRAVEFELSWLKNKRDYYARIAREDEKRIEMIEKRLGKS